MHASVEVSAREPLMRSHSTWDARTLRMKMKPNAPEPNAPARDGHCCHIADADS